MNIDWKDISSYSQSDKEQIPTCFEAKIGGLRLVIVSSHIDTRGQEFPWLFTCEPFCRNANLPRIPKEDVKQAQETAFRCAYRKVHELSKAFDEVIL